MKEQVAKIVTEYVRRNFIGPSPMTTPSSPEVVDLVESALPVTMITLADGGIYVSDQRFSKWEKVTEYPKNGLC